ncbi:hypothetical protein DSO57_1024462 [Entomophthora muscae]|uniref:Uncharacterized protein n=1 Tax=Entomophthora muscae TaxID=34485 RepID=A0ACC2S4L4_9FUNG|nr:hypothetical protein DSO57_1024462 [Entomophthora muscae]
MAPSDTRCTVHCHSIVTEPPHYRELWVMGASQPAPFLSHPLDLAFLLIYLGAYFLLERFNPLLGQYRLIGELFHMGMVSVSIGSLVTGLNPSAAIHLLGGPVILPEDPADPTPVLFCPPGASFSPINFAE